MQLYGCVVLCYANSVIRWHFSPVDLFQLPGDLTEIKTDRPSFGIFTHQVRKQARIVFGPFSVQKDNTNLAQRSAPHTGFTSITVYLSVLLPGADHGRRQYHLPLTQGRAAAVGARLASILSFQSPQCVYRSRC